MPATPAVEAKFTMAPFFWGIMDWPVTYFIMKKRPLALIL
jgi:hypothetical protein